ncbi:MAG: sel1 repeat family protein, partial [Candidatus Competibacteraceae bacterium]|nr:sel1 repeat family protein [Candidatus Competibacteraceae bacterium]
VAAAQLNLGLMYADGRGGLPKNESQAAAWYRKAAEQNVPLAQLLLGVLYAMGRGVPQDDQQAFAWFEKAANNHLSLAQYGLGMLYSNGRGVKTDWIKAHLWLDLAVSSGYVGAAQPLDSVASRLSQTELAEARQLAQQWRMANDRY